MCDNQRGNKMPAIRSKNQLIEAPDLKEEMGIKEESLSIGNLVEVSALNTSGTEQTSAIVIESDSEDDSAGFDSHEAKIEVMEDGIKKKKKESKANCPAKDVMNNKRRKQLPKRSKRNTKFNRKKSNSCNENKSLKVKAQGKGLKKHECQPCEYTTKHPCNLKKHLLKHTGEMPFPCSQCSKRFKWKQNLQAHMETHADDFLFNCSTCFQGFNERNRKLIHEAKCRILRYECCFCKKSFGSRKVDLICHMRIHSGEKPFACPQCSQRFTVKCSLKRHMKTHVDLRSSKQRHRKTYECHLCKKFIGSRYTELKQHMRQHSGEKPFRCEMSFSTFTRKHRLIRHLDSIHSSDKVTAKVPEPLQQTTVFYDTEETSKTVNSIATSAICPTNEVDSVPLPTDIEMDTSNASDQSLATNQQMSQVPGERSVVELTKTIFDVINQKNQQSLQAMELQKLKDLTETSVVEDSDSINQNNQPSTQQNFGVSICSSTQHNSLEGPVPLLPPEVAVESTSIAPSIISAPVVPVPPQEYSNLANLLKSAFRNMKNESVKREGLLQIQELILELSAKDMRLQREMNASNNTY